MSDTLVNGDAVAETTGPDGSPEGQLPPYMIDVSLLTTHPGNVRDDLDLSQEFLASIAAIGVRVPLLVTPDDNGYQVIEGHRRLAAAVKTGQTHVPCVADPGPAGDPAGQFLDMVVANSDGYRKNFSSVEEAAALFAAHEAGASRTRIRKATGRKAEEVKTALAVGGISGETREAAGELASQLSLDQLALLAEFDGDPDSVTRIVEALSYGGYSAEHVAERIRQDRAEAAQHEQLAAEFKAAGTAITEDLPPGAARLNGLLHDGKELTPDTHAACPGRGVYFPSWNPLQPVHYCASPPEHGHTIQTYGLPVAGNGAAAEPETLPDPPADSEPSPDPSRKIVIEGNKAWKAAAEVRKRWLAGQLFPRRAAPREAARFAAAQLLSMPEPLRSGLACAPGRLLFTDVTSQPAASWLEITATTAAARLPLLMLGPIVTAYEHAMTEGEGRNTWRTDRSSPCPRREASRYLTFLSSIGYQLSGIEQAVADDVPWTGDEDPARPVLGNSGSDLSEGADDDARDVPWETDDAALERRGEDQANVSPEAA